MTYFFQFQSDFIWEFVLKPLNAPVPLSLTYTYTLSPQPLENEEDIQAAFSDWLHTQSHEPLACLTPRSGKILFHADEGDRSSRFPYVTAVFTLTNQCGDAQNQPVLSLSSVAKLDFVLTVLKPEAEDDPPDQLFLLSPAVIRKENIQVNNWPLLKFKLVIKRTAASAYKDDRICV